LVQRASAIKLQALYRGHIGRLAAMKWAVKKAEIDAMRALQHAAAVSGWGLVVVVVMVVLFCCSAVTNVPSAFLFFPLSSLSPLVSSLLTHTGGHRTRVAWCHGAAGSGRATH
jgi:cytochrome bd-type quinol oxidase subunit 2